MKAFINLEDWLSVQDFVKHYKETTKKNITTSWIYQLINGYKYKTKKKIKKVKPVMKLDIHYMIMGDKPFIHKTVIISHGNVKGGINGKAH